MTNVRDYRQVSDVTDCPKRIAILDPGPGYFGLNRSATCCATLNGFAPMGSLKAFEGLGPAQSAEPFVAADPAQAFVACAWFTPTKKPYIIFGYLCSMAQASKQNESPFGRSWAKKILENQSRMSGAP